MPCQIKSQTSVWDETVYLAYLYVCQVCLLYNWQKNEYYKLRLLKLVFKNRSIHSFLDPFYLFALSVSRPYLQQQQSQ